MSDEKPPPAAMFAEECRYTGWVWVPIHTPARQINLTDVPGDEPDEPAIVEAPNG